MDLNFRTYEELSDFCYPFEKNLGNREWSDDEKNRLLDQIGRFYRQRLDEITLRLGYRHTNVVSVSFDSSYLGRCYGAIGIIDLDVGLVCHHPVALTEVIIHELTHYIVGNHQEEFYRAMESNVRKLGLDDILYGYDKYWKYPSSKEPYYMEVDRDNIKVFRKMMRPSFPKKSFPPYPNGTLVIKSAEDWISHCRVENLIRIRGLLDRAKIIHFANMSLREYSIEVGHTIGINLELWDIRFSGFGSFSETRRLLYPIWMIALPWKIICRIVVYSLTSFFKIRKGDFETRLKKNLRLMNLNERPSGFYTSNLMKSMKPWEDLFDENGNPRIKYVGDSQQ